jgi:hypothetical protein
MSDPAMKPPLKWWQDDVGDTSMMRIGAMIGVWCGALCVIAGVALAIVEVVIQSKVTAAGVALAGIGAGLIGTVLATKALQRGAEAKIAAAAAA